MACGCYSTSNINCNIDATVCQGYFVIAIPSNGITAISEQGIYGTASVYPGGYIIYEHTADNTSSDTVTYLNSYGNECTLSITVEDTIPTNTQIITLSASGDCEVGSPTFTWHLPIGTILDDGYNIHQQNINVIVPTFDINNPSATYIFTVDVCCDYCANCCKCETINWYPPNCTLQCGEDPSCNCNHLPCHVYNPLSGNCEPTCEVDEVCCDLTTSGDYVIFGNVTIECNILPTAISEITDLSLTIIPNVTGALVTDIIWHIFNFDGDCNEPINNGCVDFRVCDNNLGVLTTDNPILIVSGFATYELDDGNLIFTLNENFLSGENESFALYFTQEVETSCGSAYKSTAIYGDLGGVHEHNCGPSGIVTVFHEELQALTMCNVSASCEDITQSYCAECCNTDDCYIAGCDNSDYICQGNECYCVVGNELIPAPTDGTCCPECVSSTTLVDCYQCINNVIVAPNTTCPEGYIYNWDTCSCVANPCLINQCIVPDASLYCPDIVDCGCEEIGNTTICIPCNTVSCTASIDCPFGCACENGTCTDNPCVDFQCNNPSSLTYCPPQENCGCDDNEICIPCNTVSCTGDINCPLGCMCDENEQVCIANLCITAEIECDAYFLHHENDLTLTKTCVGNNHYLITPALALEPNILPSDGNTTWWVNLSNYVDGWYEVTGSVIISGITAIQKVGGKLKIFYAANINYISIMCLMNGRKIWYRLNGVTDAGVGCQYAELDLGGAFLCGEIFTIESNSGIEWSVDEWFVTSGNVTYSSTGENAVLVIECAGTETVELSAEVSNEICTISTCPTSYLCNCTGSKDCDKYEINFNDNFNQSTYIWTIDADILYEGEPGFAWYDCELPNPLQLPTPYTCERCGINPYESMDVANGNGDNSTSITPPNCFNPSANNNCTCACGWTYSGVELISHLGAAITVHVTDPFNAQVCFQADIAGTDAEGPCCISNCLLLEFEPQCNLDINLIIECQVFGNYILNVEMLSGYPNSEIQSITVDGNLIPFTLNSDGTATVIYTASANVAITVLVTDTYGCTAETNASTPCCDFQVDIQPLMCEDIYGISCQSCGITGNTLIIGYDIVTYDLPLPYLLYINTNDPVTNLPYQSGPISVNTNNKQILQLSLLPSCEELVINEAYITYNGCTTYVVSGGEVCSGNCYHGLWSHVGSDISKWNTPSHISYNNYKITGLQINDGINNPTSLLFSTYGIPDIDLKAIICQAHKNAGTSSCNQNTITTVGCVNTVITSTTCYSNPPSCISSNLPSLDLKTYHDNILSFLYAEWQCKITVNGGTYLTAINNILVNNLNLAPFDIWKQYIPSTSYANDDLPDGSFEPQWHYYRYMVITKDKYPLGTIKLLRTINTVPNLSPLLITIGCESGDCYTPTSQYRYNCEACTTPVQGGTYATTAECILNCSNDEYGYDCGECYTLVLNGEYATSNLCVISCPTGNVYWTCQNDCESAVSSGPYESQLECLSECEQDCNATISEMLITNEEGNIQEEGNYEYTLLNIDNIYEPLMLEGRMSMSIKEPIDTSIFDLSKDTITNSLSHVTNMYNYGFGTKVTNDIDTKEPCILVFVDNKQDVDDSIKVPETINGYKTDVIVGEKYVNTFSTYCAGDCYQTSGSTVLYNQPTSCYDDTICWECQAYSGGNCISYIPCNPSGQQDACPSGTCDSNGSYKDRNNHCNTLENRDSLLVTTPGQNQGTIKLMGGTSGAGANINCTFGIVARDNIQNGKLVGLVNNHCFRCAHYSTLSSQVINNVLTDYIQTSPTDYASSPFTRVSRQVGTFNREYPIYPTGNTVDCAVFDLLFPNYVPDGTYLYYTVPDTGVFNVGNGPYEWMTESEVNTSVIEHWPILKSGRTTGAIDTSTLYVSGSVIMGEFTVSAKISSINVQGCYCSETQTSSYTCSGTVPEFLDVILIKNNCNEGRYVGAPGDSSSPVLTVNPDTGEIKLLGLLFAGSCGSTYIIPMYNIATELDVSYWDGTIIVHTNGEEFISIDGKNYQIGNATNEHVTHILD